MEEQTERIVVQSARLIVRTWQVGDVPAFQMVMSDPRVHTYTGEQPWTLEQTRSMVEECIRHKLGHEPDYFNCPLILRASGQLIGRVGLNPFLQEKRVPEIEWTLGSEHWGQGYATEIGREILGYGFEQAGFEEIVGFARPEHVASRRVMEKLGMKYSGDRPYRGRTYSFYGLAADHHSPW